ncbi:CidA/LrgA family protein [Paenibacillus hamazuiensis]|uniref:CidA/LrgA family protein n=1 Tax=Paenibacillus hamazuiensis TaxID=2936508 RepID=UPI00200D4BC3|nr:CidA/LrgA family protein [Paenibacillus hamazuiensis]
MRGFAILLAFYLAGMSIQKGLNVPLPGNVIGLALFTLFLFTGLIKLKWVEKTASFLNRHMLLFFAPIIAGTLSILPLIREHAASIVVTFFISWLAVLLATGWTVRALTGRKKASSSPNIPASWRDAARREHS